MTENQIEMTAPQEASRGVVDAATQKKVKAGKKNEAYGQRMRYLVRAKHVRIHNVTELGVLLRITRKRLKMSISEAAECCGVGRRFYTELENGKPSVQFDSGLAVLDALGLELFMGGVGARYSPEELANARIEKAADGSRHLWSAELANDLDAPFGTPEVKRRRRSRKVVEPTCDIECNNERFVYNPITVLLQGNSAESSQPEAPKADKADKAE